MSKKGRHTVAFIRRVRKIADKRKAIPSERELATEGGCSVATIRGISSRRLYKDVK